jgi:hypothetical protein
MAGLDETLGSPWPPLAIRPCLFLCGSGVREINFDHHYVPGEVYFKNTLIRGDFSGTGNAF